MATGPLDGIRVLEFCQIVAGPVIGQFLADLGADVVKVEPPEGDAFRRTGSVVPGTSKGFQWYNRGKRSLILNLRDPRAQAIVHRMVPSFDVVVANPRPGVLERQRIDYETLSALRPDLIYARVTGFGPEGPLADQAASDIVGQAYSGMLADEGAVDEWGAPRRTRALPISDLLAGLSATVGIASALYHRQLTGEGQLIDASLLRGAMGGVGRAVTQEPVTDAVITGPARQRVRDALEAGESYAEAIQGYGQGGLAPTGAVRRIYHTSYETSDGAIVVGALTRANRQAIREAIGFEYEGGDEPEFDPLDEETRRRMVEFKQQVAAIVRTRTTAEWVEALRRTGAPAAPLRFPEELADDEQTASWFVELDDPLSGPQRQLNAWIEMSKTPPGAQGPAPPLGGHSAEVLREFGYDDGEIASLRDDGVVT
ncbi:MAG: CoA transferase [Chloroflexi bacterium]|nr:CoA transferase [Chloroflexota bacterium]